jgi:hypothetical protein
MVPSFSLICMLTNRTLWTLSSSAPTMQSAPTIYLFKCCLPSIGEDTSEVSATADDSEANAPLEEDQSIDLDHASRRR